MQTLCRIAILVNALLLARAEAAPMIHRTTGTIDTDGETIYYENIGEGPALVLSHGLGGNHAIWFQQVPVFAKTHRVITWDQRGFGRSSNRGGKAGPVAAVADLKAVLDHLGVERAHMAGQSMGGWAVLGFALENPGRVESLVLADTIAGIYTPEIEAHYDVYIRSVMAGPKPDDLPIGKHPALGEKFSEADPARAFLYSQIGSAAPPAPATMGLTLRQTAWDSARFGQIKCPILFVVGAEDPIFPPAIVRAASTKFPGSQVVEIPGAGHSPYFEIPDAWNDVVGKFLETVSK